MLDELFETYAEVQHQPSGYEAIVLGRRRRTIKVGAFLNYRKLVEFCKMCLGNRHAQIIEVYQFGTKVAVCDLEKARFYKKVNEFNGRNF